MIERINRSRSPESAADDGAVGDQVEQQLAPRVGERQVAEFIDNDEIVAQQLLGQTTTAASSLLLLELVDEIDQIKEAPPGTGADDGRRDSNAEMRFAGAG